MKINKLIYKAGTIIIVISTFFIMCSIGWTATYYVDATNGNDVNTGTSESTPWKTITKVNASIFNPGDQILFKRGGIWKELLIVPSSGSSGNSITFGAYGSGNKPIITGANLLTTWTDTGVNVWSKSVTKSPRIVFFNGTLGNKQASLVAVDSDKDWYWVSNVLYIYSAGNPDTVYTTPGIEAGKRDNIVIVEKNYIRLENLQLEKANAATGSGVEMSGAGLTGVQVGYCDIKECVYGVFMWTSEAQGGGHLIEHCSIHDNTKIGVYVSGENGGDGSTENNRTRIANNLIYNNMKFGILVYTSYWTVEFNKVYNNGFHDGNEYVGIEIYAGVCGEGGTAGAGDYNIIRYNEVYSNIGDGQDGGGIMVDCYCDNNEIYYNIIHDNDGPGISNLSAKNTEIYNNTLYNNSLNSSGQLVNKTEIRLSSGGAYYPSENATVKNNLAYSVASGNWAIYVGGSPQTGQVIENNLFYRSDSADWWKWDTTTGTSLSTFNSQTGSSNNLFGDPKFISTATPDFNLQLTSPCINAGTDISLTRDYVGNKKWGSAWDIGAYEWRPSSPLSAPRDLRIIP